MLLDTQLKQGRAQNILNIVNTCTIKHKGEQFAICKLLFIYVKTNNKKEVSVLGRNTVYNQISSPEKIKKINKSNIALRDDFLAYLKSIGRSSQTIKQYKNDLNIFFIWNLDYNNDKSFEKVGKRNFVAFQRWLLEENHNSSSRICRIKSVLSSLSKYIENILDDEDDFKNFKSVVNKIENPAKQIVREKTVLSDEQVRLILDFFTKRGQYEKACIVALAATSGRRKAELPRFKTHFFDKENKVFGGSLYKSPEKIKTKGKKGTGEAGKQIYVYTLAEPFQPYYDRWMQYRKEHGIESEWLFPNKFDYSQPISISTLNSYATTISNIIGEPFYFHALRHYFTTKLSKLGIPDSVIQLVVGWDSIDMVGVYKDVSEEEELSKYFTSEGIVSQESKGLNDL